MAIIGEADNRQTIANSIIAISKRQYVGEIAFSYRQTPTFTEVHDCRRC